MMGCWAWGAAPEAYLLGLVTDTAWRFRPPFSQAASQHFPQSPRVGLLSRCTQTRRLKMHPLQAGCPRSGRQQGWLPEAALSPCPHVNASLPVCVHMSPFYKDTGHAGKSYGQRSPVGRVHAIAKELDAAY